MRTARHSKQRGAASVEAAISMLIIIPAFMYALFLDDLLRYAADLQEAVLSTPWDFTGQNYTQPNSRGLGSYTPKSEPYGGKTLAQNHARLMYCDHESSGDTYSPTADVDCDSENHHVGKALSGHVCWLNSEAKQVTCEPVQGNVGLLSPKLYADYRGKFGQSGGLYECYGKEVVENYLLPKTFLQEFAGKDKDVQMTKENWSNNSGGVHDNAKAGDKSTAYYLAEQRAAVLTDSWAVNEIPNAAGGDENESQLTLESKPGQKSGEFYNRVDHVFSGNDAHSIYKPLVTAFAAQASKKLLMPTLVADMGSGVFDDPTTPNVALSKVGDSPTQEIEQDKGKHKYYSTPWKDWASNPYEKTHGNRGKYYMGCKDPQKYKC